MVDVPIDQNDGFAQQIAANAQTIFDYDFPVFDESYIQVLMTDGVTGDISELTLTDDYTVQDVGEEEGGTITLTSGATAGDIYTMRLNVPEARVTDFQQAGDFFARVLNLEFDLQTQMIQQLRRDLARKFGVSDDSTITDLALSPLAGALIGWNADGTGSQNYLPADINLATVTPFIATLLDDINAATARATLGAQAAGSYAASGANSDITSLSAIASINGGQLGGLRNKIINGDFRRWDYATTYALTTSAAYGSANRWAANMGSSAAGIFNRDTNPPGGFFYNAKVGRNNSSSLTNAPAIMQVLETVNSVPLAGQTVTLSYYARKGANFSAASSALAVAAFTGTGLDQSPASMIAGTWTGQTTPLSATDTLTTSWQRFQHTFAIPSNATQVGAIFSFTPVGTAGADDNFYITGVQLEIGAVATPFEDRGEAIEEILCGRYAPTFTPGNNKPIAVGNCSGTTTGQILLNLPVETRVPTTGITVSDVTHFQMFNSTASAITCATLVINSTFGASTKAIMLDFTVASGLTAGNATQLTTRNASAKLVLTGAEL